MSRSVLYVSGSRADFGLMRRTLATCRSTGKLNISVLATGQHLLAAYGRTIDEIIDQGFAVAARIPVELSGSGGAEMAQAIGQEVIGITRALTAERPDIVLLLGDRGEMLAGAIAALHIGIPSVHIHGGELSGSVDEPVRHAISKLAHIHLAATENARDRLLRLGEDEHRIFVVGAPGLDDAFGHKAAPREQVASTVGFDHRAAMAVLLYHPVVQESREGGPVVGAILDVLVDEGIQTLVLAPNSDAGGAEILASWQRFYSQLPRGLMTRFHAVDHLSRDQFFDWVAASDVLIGNSSSGIIESATLGTPCVNIGTRQQYRERNQNTIDVHDLSYNGIRNGLRRAVRLGKGPWRNLYGDGTASIRISRLLADIQLGSELLRKQNTF